MSYAEFIWEQQEGETDAAFHAFKCYRDLHPRQRTFRKAAEIFFAVPSDRDENVLETENGRIVDPDSEIVTPSRRRRLEHWGRRHSWVKRARAWDRWKDRAEQEALLEELRQMARRQARQLKVASASLSIAGQALIAKAKAFQDAIAKLAASGDPRDVERAFGIATRAAKELPALHEAEREAMGLLKNEADDRADVPMSVMDGVLAGDDGEEGLDDGQEDEG